GQRRNTRRWKASLRIARPPAGGPLGPAVEAALLNEVDLVVAAEAEVAGRAVAACVEPAEGIEREALRAAKAPCEHLAASSVHMDAHDLPAEAVGVGCPRRYEPLAGGEVEPTVGPQLEPAAEVVAGTARDAVDEDLFGNQLVAGDRKPGDAVDVATGS